MGVESVDNLLTLHGELHAQRGVREVDDECLVADVKIVGVAGDDLTHHLWPGVDESFLKQRRFEPLRSEVLQNDFLDEYAVALKQLMIIYEL